MSKTQIRGVEQILPTSVDLTGEVTNTLPVGNGGTGAANLGSNTILLGNGTAAVNTIAPSVTGNVLTDTGSSWVSAAPSGAPPTSMQANLALIAHTQVLFRQRIVIGSYQIIGAIDSTLIGVQ